MAITDINISEQLQTDAPSIKYTGTEGPQASPQHQQEQMIAQQIWEALGPEQQGQFQSFEQFFQSGVWKQILQQMQQDEGQGPEQQQGIGSLGPGPMEQQMPMPNRMGAEYGGRMGYQGGELVEQEDVNIMTPQGDVSMQETVEEGAMPDQLSFQELRSRLPAEVTDDIIRLITNSAEALTDFAKIQTQQDVDNFNAKYGVNLVLPSEA